MLKRQLDNYLSEPTSQEKKLGKARPMHIMEAERLMSMTDAQVRRAPNASMDVIEAKVKSKTNHTLQWLQSASADGSRGRADTRITTSWHSTRVVLSRWQRQFRTLPIETVGTMSGGNVRL